MKIKAMLLTVFLLTASVICHAAPKISLKVRPSNTWTTTIGETDLSGGAGTDTFAVESSASVKTLTITKSDGNWQIEVSFSDTSAWDSNITLYIRRTGSGSGGTVSGTTDYIELSSSNQVFMTGSGDVDSIPLQYKIGAGLASAGVPADTLTVEVTFTITDGL